MRKFRIIYGFIVLMSMILFFYFQDTKTCEDNINNYVLDKEISIRVLSMPKMKAVYLKLIGIDSKNNEKVEYKNNFRIIQDLSKSIEVNDTFIKKEGSSTYIIGKKGYRYLFELRCVENKSYTYTFIDSSSSLWKVPDSVLPKKGGETIYYK